MSCKPATLTFYKALSLVLLGVCSFHAVAEDDPNNSAEGEGEEWWKSTHEVMSEKVGSWSNGLDAFFSGKRHEEASQSFVSMRFGSIVESEDGVSGFFNLDAKLSLPNTQNRLDLIIESDGDRLTQDNQVRDNSTGQNILQSARDTRFATVLRYFKEEWDTNIDFGVLLKMPVDPFMRIKVQQEWQVDQWSLTQDESLFTYYSLGNGGRYSLRATRPINERFGFGVEFGTTYLSQDSEIYWRENIYVTHSVTDRDKLRYQLSYLQEGDTPHSDSVLYYLQYQRLLYRDWLIGEIKPQITHKREDDYKAEFSLTLSLEVLLGQRFL